MNWALVSFDWNQARAFLATVEEGSLSAAARELGLTQPTLGRQVAALEEKLGVLLFERVGKSLVLTQSGLELLDHVRTMCDAAGRISLAASGQSQTVEGRVCITASDVMSAYILPDAIKRLREQAPLLEIDIFAANDIRNLQLREADIAIRHVRPEEPDLIAKLIGNGAGTFYASQEYLEKHGRPESEDDLAHHGFIGFGDDARLVETLNEMGLSLSSDNFRVGSASGLVAWEMARAGLGIIIMSDKVGENTAGMERLLPNREPMLFPIWLTAHRELHTSRRIRLVYDFLADYLTEEMF